RARPARHRSRRLSTHPRSRRNCTPGAARGANKGQPPRGTAETRKTRRARGLRSTPAARGSGGALDAVVAMSERGELALEHATRAEQPRHHGADRNAQRIRDVLVFLAAEVGALDDVAVL